MTRSARAFPMTRTIAPPARCACHPKTCSTRARVRDRSRFPLPLLLTQRGRPRASLVEVATKLPLRHDPVDILALVRRVSPPVLRCVFHVQKVLELLDVASVRWRHSVLPYQLVLIVDDDMVLVAKVRLAPLHRPSSIRVLLSPLVLVLLSLERLRRLTLLQLLVLPAAVEAARAPDDARVHDVALRRSIAFCVQVLFESPKHLVKQVFLLQTL